MVLEALSFKGSRSGLNVLLLGRIHGDESVGEVALNKLAEELIVKSGSVRMIPCCNPKASEANKRFVDVNLNRIISPELVKKYSDCYEAQCASQIMGEISRADIVIDIHSYSDDVEPCVVCIDDNETARSVALACNITNIVCDSEFLTSGDTQATFHYAKKIGKPAILIEAGQHDDDRSIDRAYLAIINILNLLDITSVKGKFLANNKSNKFFIIKGAIYNDAKYQFIFPLMQKCSIAIGDPLFKKANGEIICSDNEGILFLRNENAATSEEYGFISNVFTDWPA